MTYLDVIAARILEEDSGDWKKTLEFDRQLYRLYAVLCLATGAKTTEADVHNAWAAWQLSVDYKGEHRSLVPYQDLAEDVRAKDTSAHRAICIVAITLEIERSPA